MFLIDSIKPNVEKKSKVCFSFYARGGESEAYKIKPVLFFLAFSLFATTKTLFKRNEKIYSYKFQI